MSSLKQKVVKGVFWTLLEKLGVQAMRFVVTLVLARLLTPTDYGTIALLTVFVSMASWLADSGLGLALIQKKTATELDFNSAFYLNVLLSVVFYFLLFFSAPLIASFYHTPNLIPVLRVMSLSLIVSALNSVQNAELQRKLLFNLSFRISMIGIFVSGTVGITSAVGGYGVWALVWSQLAGAVAGMIARWYFIAWRPKIMFSRHSVKELFAFGWKMAASHLLNIIFNNLYVMLIGRFYTKADLAFVTKGRSLPELVMNTINGTLATVAFPALSQLQDQSVRLREAMRKMIKVSTFMVMPLMTAIACSADAIVVILLGDQWLEAIPYVRISCFTFALWPFQTINLQVIGVKGRSDIYLKLEIIKKVLGVVVLLASVRLGVWWLMAILAFVVEPLNLMVNSWPNRKMLDYSVSMQFRDAWVTTVLCAVMALFIVPVCFLPLPPWARLLLQAPLGMFVFLALSLFFKPQPFVEIVNILRPVINARSPMWVRRILLKFDTDSAPVIFVGDNSVKK